MEGPVCTVIFAERVESDGTPLAVTLLEAAWRIGKTDKTVRKDGHGRIFEEDCDAVNQARASKSTTVNTLFISVFSAEILHRWKMPTWSAEGPT